MILTTNFANIKKLPEGVEPVSIAIFPPKTVKIRSCSRFYPPQDLLAKYKAGEIDDAGYMEVYRNSVLAHLDAAAAGRALDGKALVCFEKAKDFCHRHLVAEWFNAHGIECKEFEPPKASRKKSDKKKPEGEISLFDSPKESAPAPSAPAIPSAVRKFPLRYKEIHGDLFSAPERYAFAHCVSADKALGAGIALEFRNRFPNMLKKLEGTMFEVGKCYGYTEPNPRRSIINIVTKEHYYDKPTYENFSSALADLKRVVVAHRIKFLAVPLLGCGLDGLDWERVSYILTGTFFDVDVAIVVYRKD